LLWLTSTDGGGLHVYGASSTGKTTSLRAAASVWGQGNAQGFIRTWHSTTNGLEAAAALSSDTMMALDELGTADADDVSDAIYQLSNGAGKGRAQRSGDAQKAKQWRVMFVSSGELPIQAKLAQARTKRAMAGQLTRMVDIEADGLHALGIFDSCGKFDDAGALAHAISNAASRNYGTAGPEFLRRLIAVGPANVAERVRKDFVEPLMKSLGSDPSGQVTRVAQRFAVIGAAGELATEWGICPWREGEAQASAKWLFDRWVADRGGASVAAEERHAVERVRTFLQTHGDSRFESLDRVQLVEDEPILRPTINRAGWRQGHGLEREWFLLREAWNEMCGDLDPRHVAQVLQNAGHLAVQGSGNLTGVKKIHGVALRVYCLTAGALGETEKEEDAIAA
jgi:uncharacterized protein (DUF927 family)